MDLIRIIIAILLPPLGVFLQVGFAGAFWLNILLTLLGYIPGIIHAVWIIARRCLSAARSTGLLLNSLPWPCRVALPALRNQSRAKHSRKRR